MSLLIVWRLAVVQNPSTAAESVGLVGIDLDAVSLLIGTWMAMVWTFFVASELIPAALANGIKWWLFKGRGRPGRKRSPGRQRNLPALAGEDNLAGMQLAYGSGRE